jgi:AcrR family transcriptional regulator
LDIDRNQLLAELEGMPVPRVGLNTADVVTAGAVMADEAGIGAVSLASLAERLGVKPPALYKHVASLGDLQHRIAALAMTELGETLRDALQGKAGSEALAAMFGAMRRYVAEHPGRYSATVGAEFQSQDDPLLAASVRVIRSIGAVLSGYGVAPEQTDHAIRALRCVVHGFALLQSGNAFQWGNDPEESFAWMIRFVDAGLRAMGGQLA